MVSFEELEQHIRDIAYTDKQVQEALDILEKEKPKIKYIVSYFVYDKQDEKEISVSRFRNKIKI